MVMETVKEKIERDKLRAELFLKNNTQSFIIDSKENYHFCYLTHFDEDKIEVKEFTGKLTGQNNTINWVDILRFEEFQKGGK